ncbi:testis-expressed protein 10 homolog [Hetaerina americana]|uniref:testis-expressed protein 10 homolog n=1 Tax=Hetaerina americana TaxID=62018 RepID=UPI003A7F6273
MGKRGHHKKNIKKEQNKVKFKVGRTLPKGQNITDTSFKVKKVVIKEQLKAGGLEPVTKRNLNLKETLTRLQHYNTNVKLDNLSGLKEILTNNQELLWGNLQSVLEKLAELISDRESPVRKEAISQLANIIAQVPSPKLAPFVCLLCSYLGAALSHINKDIQLDALLLLDGMLSRPSVSALILASNPSSPSASHPFDLILQGLINQISEQKETSSGKTSGWERKLSVNPAGKMADVQRRAKVLSQLCSLMKAALEMRRKSCSKDVSSEGANCVKWKDIVALGSYVPCYGPSYASIQGLALSRTLTSTFSVPASISSAEPMGECEKLKVLVSSLVPILLESWKEIGPAKDASTNSLLTAEAGEFLKIMLDILTILLEALTLYDRESAEAANLIHWFRSCYSRAVFDLLMPIFPFSSLGIRGKRKQGARGHRYSEWSVESFNEGKAGGAEEGSTNTVGKPSESFYTSILMAQLYCALELVPTPFKKQGKKMAFHQKYLSKILNFLIKSLDNSTTCHHHGKQMSDLVWHIISCRKMSQGNFGSQVVKLDDVKLLIKSVITCCDSDCPHRRNSAALNCPFFKLLCNILKDNQLAELQRLQDFENWVTKLPNLLNFPCPKAFEVLSQIAQRCNAETFHATVKTILPELFAYLKTSQDVAVSEENLKKAFTLLHWVQNWNGVELNALGEVVKMYPQQTSSLVELFRARKEYLGAESEFSVILESMTWWPKSMSLICS